MHPGSGAQPVNGCVRVRDQAAQRAVEVDVCGVYEFHGLCLPE